ncbi:M20/M25/M40 family metallo-hydrolase [Lacipirellula parvula]|uniref:Bacterial leucyl aminopeptidase n=1 Tax=Lacipirellula parvula TaxID=2650471 RepID=A0A5K7XLN6_9BACT|nr:M20/M25/M40 family metallo-hydrolase [Lacipirellula parvula]BBO35586.1 bacterial leucyl aminopeptidase [Lacipirellula parvula]
MRKALTDCGLYKFFDPDLLVYSSIFPPSDPNSGEAIKPKPDPSIFRYAVGLTELEANHCVFVGEDALERGGAISAGMRVAPDPRLAEDVLENVPLRYLRIGAPQGEEGNSWFSNLQDLPIVALGLLAGKVLAIASAKTAANLDDAGYDVIRLGAPNAPDATDVYLLRDDARVNIAAEGFAAAKDGKEGSSSQFFGASRHADAGHDSNADAFTGNREGTADEPWNWVLMSDYSGLLVGIPAGETIESFHFTGSRHGHTLKLMPSPHRLREFTAGVGFGPATTFRDLRSDEIDQLSQLDAEHIRLNLDRFVGLADVGDGNGPIRSRHIKHPDNRRAVQALAAEFENLGLSTRFHRFTHEGSSLDNVEAELPGIDNEIILITAHLDSTAAEGDAIFRPSQDAAPGADDDGSGVAAALSLARIIFEKSTARQLQRTVRFVLFNAEEQGLVGSQAYASEAADRGDHIVAVFQMDMIGYTGDNQTSPRPFEIHIGHQSDAMTTASRPLADLIRRFQPSVATDLLPPQVYDNTHPPGGDPAAGRSDHASFHDHGYPACVLSEDFFVGPDTTSPAPQDNPNYHKPGDTSVEYDYAAQIARCIGAAVFVIADPADAADSFDSQSSLGVHSMSSYLNIDKAREARKSSSFAEGRSTDGFQNFLLNDPALKGEAPPVVSGANLLTGTSRRIVLNRPAGFGIPEDATPAGRISQALALVRHIDAAQSSESHVGNRRFASYLGDDSTTEDQPGAADFFADPVVQQIASGDQFVYLNQHYRGIPVFTMARTVRFASKGSAVELTGDHAPYISPSLEVRPAVPAADAVRAAVQYISEHQAEDDTPDEYGQLHPASQINLQAFSPVVHARFSSPSQPIIYEAQGLGATVPASLVVYMSGIEAPRLAWDILVTLPLGERQYRVLVPADEQDGELLYVRQVSTTMGKTPGHEPEPKVWATDAAVAARTADAANTPQPPATPSYAAAAPATAAGTAVSAGVYFPSPASSSLQDTSFPLDVSKYPLGITTPPAALNLSWVDAGQAYAVGPNAIAVRGFGSPNLPSKRLKGDDSVTGKLTFNSSDPVDQQLANIFFFCNYIHDFFFLLGFDVAAGNFEGDDGVIARSHPGPVAGTANMLTHPDHQRPVMNMGLVAGVNRHTAFDADVVFHEYVHGVSNRLVGGPMNALALEAEQSGSMGEGWSDYFALTIQNYSSPGQERTTTGDWVVDQPGVGIRSAPYDDKYHSDFGDMATVFELQEVHNAGEIWCACLMHLTRKMVTALGNRDRAYRECWQIVVDSFKVCPANPSFIDARDAILTALEGRHTAQKLNAAEFQDCRKAAWTAFAGFGMGAKAPNNGSDFASAISDNHLPQDLGGTVVARTKKPRPSGWTSAKPLNGTTPPENNLQQIQRLVAGLSAREKAKLFSALKDA